jgi:hypothetical protein
MRWLALLLVVAISVAAVLGARHIAQREPAPNEPRTKRPTPSGTISPAHHGVACGDKADDAVADPQRPRLFARDSVWNRPLAANAAQGDQALAKLFRAEIDREIRAGIGPWIQTSDYSTPLYTVGSAQRCVRVTLDVTQPYGQTLRRAFRRVPLPANARPSAGTDGHLTLWQRPTDSLWEFWKLRRESDGWHAAWGGAMRDVSRSPGYFSRSAWPGARSSWGATATSLPAVAGTMLIRELEEGRIPHALAISIPNARAGVYALPARRSDGTLTDERAVPEGARFRLDPHVDLARLSMPRVVRIMARAAQRYGLIVRDRTSHATGFYAEDPTQFTGRDPYARLFDGRMPSVLLKSFPWRHLQALPVQLRRAPSG